MRSNDVSRQLRLLECFVPGSRSITMLRKTPDNGAGWYEFVPSGIPSLVALGFIEVEKGMPMGLMDPVDVRFVITPAGFRHLAELELYQRILKSALETSLKDLEIEMTAVASLRPHGR